MSPNEYQHGAMRTAPDLGVFRSREGLNVAALGVGGEGGEFVDLVKKHLFHGHPLDASKASKELGDILWYIALACTVLGLGMEDVMNENLEKLRKRYPLGFSAEASINREEEK